jgi:hypothetical protein
MSIRTVVYKEHSLGVVHKNGMFETLRRNVAKDGGAYKDCDCFLFKESDVREATLQDFTDYRVRYHPDYLISGA